MQLLTNLLSKEVVDFGQTESSGNQENAVTTADVFFYGLNIVMPLMTIDLLKFPSLCLQ